MANKIPTRVENLLKRNAKLEKSNADLVKALTRIMDGLKFEYETPEMMIRRKEAEQAIADANLLHGLVSSVS